MAVDPPALVYLLCALTSGCCLLLLVRSWLETGSRLVFWSALSFVGLTANNALVFVDLIVLPVDVDLLPLRNLTSLTAICVLLYGFVWEAS